MWGGVRCDVCFLTFSSSLKSYLFVKSKKDGKPTRAPEVHPDPARPPESGAEARQSASARAETRDAPTTHDRDRTQIRERAQYKGDEDKVNVSRY